MKWGKVIISKDGVITNSTEVQNMTDAEVMALVIPNWDPFQNESSE